MAVAPVEDVEVVDEAHERRLEPVDAPQVQDGQRAQAMEFALGRFPEEAWQVLQTCRWLRTEAIITAGRRSAFQSMRKACEATLHPLIFAGHFFPKMARRLVQRCPGPPEPVASAPLQPPSATPAQMLQHAASLAGRAARFKDFEGEAPLGDGQLAWCARAVLHLARSFDQGGAALVAGDEVCLGEKQLDHSKVKLLWMLPSPEEALRVSRIDQTGLFTAAAFRRLRVLWGERAPEDGQCVDSEVMALFNLAKLWRWGDNHGSLHSVQSALCHLARVERTLSRGAARYRHCKALLCFAGAVKAHLLAYPEDECELNVLLRDTQKEVERRLKRRKTMVQAQKREQEAIRATEASWAEQEDAVEAEKLQVLRRWLPNLEKLCARNQQAQEVALEALGAFCTMELDGTMAGLIMLVLGSFRRNQLLLHERLTLLSQAFHLNPDEGARMVVQLSQSCDLNQDQRHCIPESLHFFRIAQCELLRDGELLGGAYVVASLEALREAPAGSELRLHLRQHVANLRRTLSDWGEHSRLLDEPWYLHRINQISGHS